MCPSSRSNSGGRVGSREHLEGSSPHVRRPVASHLIEKPVRGDRVGHLPTVLFTEGWAVKVEWSDVDEDLIARAVENTVGRSHL